MKERCYVPVDHMHPAESIQSIPSCIAAALQCTSKTLMLRVLNAFIEDIEVRNPDSYEARR